MKPVKQIIFIEGKKNNAIEQWLYDSFTALENEFGREVTESISFVCVGTERPSFTLRDSRIYWAPYNGIFDFKFISAVRKIIKKEQPSRLWAHHDLQSGVYFFWSIAASTNKMHRLMHVHNCSRNVPTSKNLRWLSGPLIWVFNKLLTDEILAISKATQTDISRYFLIDSARVKILPYYMPQCDEIPLQRGTNRSGLCYVGRLEPEKNPLRLLSIFKEVLKIDKSCCLTIYGEGSLESAMQNAAHEYGIAHKVRFAGWINNTSQAFQKHHVFLFPRPENSAEGFGKVIVEAQMNGCITITSRAIQDDAIFSNGVLRISENLSDAIWAEKLIEVFIQDKPIIYNSEGINKFTQHALVSTYHHVYLPQVSTNHT